MFPEPRLSGFWRLSNSGVLFTMILRRMGLKGSAWLLWVVWRCRPLENRLPLSDMVCLSKRAKDVLVAIMKATGRLKEEEVIELMGTNKSFSSSLTYLMPSQGGASTRAVMKMAKDPVTKKSRRSSIKSTSSIWLIDGNNVESRVFFV